MINKIEQIIGTLDFLSIGHFPITLILPTRLTLMADQIKIDPHKANPSYTLLLHNLQYNYGKILFNFGHDKDFNLLHQFPVITELFTQKPLALYQLETVPVNIK